MKKQIIWAIAIFLIGIVFAIGTGVVNKIITIPEKPTGITGELSFNVDGSRDLTSCIVNEPDGKIDEDDIIRCAKSVGVNETQVLTNIKDWEGNHFKDDGSWSKVKP